MSSLLRVARSDMDELRVMWVSGNDLKQSDYDYVKILEEKEKLIKGLENKLSLTGHIIDRQRKAI